MSDRHEPTSSPIERFHRYKVLEYEAALRAIPELANEPTCAECLQPVSRCMGLPWCGLIYHGSHSEPTLDPAHIQLPTGWRYWVLLVHIGARAFWRGFTGRPNDAQL